MNTRPDPVDEALELLRSDDHLELPPPFRPPFHPPFHSGAAPANLRRRHPRLLPIAAVVLGLSAAAAAGGLQSLRSWWYSITVDGQRVDGLAEGDGERTAEFVTADGCRVSVRVVSETEAEGRSTGIEVTQQGPGTLLQHDVETHLTSDELDFGPETEGLTRSALVGGDKLHEWLDPEGARWALYLTADPDAEGSRLLLHEVESDLPRPVSLLGRTELPLGRGARAEVVQHPGGEVRVTLDDGRGVEFELIVAGDRDRHPATEYRSDDGRIHVRVDD